MSVEDLQKVVIGDLPATTDRDRLVRRRADLNLDDDPKAPLVVDEHGRAIAISDLPMWLRRAQTVRVNIEGNGELCRGLLRTRYHLGELEERLRTSSG